MKLLGTGTDAKTVKGEKYGYMTGILYLAPYKESGVANVCPNASAGCIASCLYTAGRGAMSNVQRARIAKTVLFKTDNATFMQTLEKDIVSLIVKATKKQLTPCVRLNGTSDIPWENTGIMQTFPNIQFYDYTKSFSRMMEYLNGTMPSNYHLTFSRDEENNDRADAVLADGGNVAIVFNTMPTEYKGFTVLDGDLSDLRFGDAKNCVVGLKAKGKAKKDTSGFVV